MFDVALTLLLLSALGGGNRASRSWVVPFVFEAWSSRSRRCCGTRSSTSIISCANDISSAYFFRDMANNILPIILLTLALRMNYVRRSVGNADPGRRVATGLIVIMMCIAEALAFSMLVRPTRRGAAWPRSGTSTSVRRHRAGDGDRAGDAGVATAGSGLAGRGLSMSDPHPAAAARRRRSGRSRADRRLLRADTPAPTPHYRATPSRTCSSAWRHGDLPAIRPVCQLATPRNVRFAATMPKGGRPARRGRRCRRATVKWARC